MNATAPASAPSKTLRRMLHSVVMLGVVAGSLFSGLALQATPAAAAQCGAAFAAPFTDVPVTHPFCNEIHVAKLNGAVGGYPDGTFRPGNLMTRQAVASIVFDAITADSGYLPPPCDFAPFLDVPTSHPFCPKIRDLAFAGLVSGYPDGTFRPADPITRQAAAAMVVKVHDSPIVLPPCPVNAYVDVLLNHPFCPEILALKLNDVATGYPDGTFRPTDHITRQAFTAMLIRWIELFD